MAIATQLGIGLDWFFEYQIIIKCLKILHSSQYFTAPRCESQCLALCDRKWTVKCRKYDFRMKTPNLQKKCWNIKKKKKPNTLTFASSYKSSKLTSVFFKNKCIFVYKYTYTIWKRINSPIVTCTKRGFHLPLLCIKKS